MMPIAFTAVSQFVNTGVIHTAVKLCKTGLIKKTRTAGIIVFTKKAAE